MRFGITPNVTSPTTSPQPFACHPGGQTEAIVLFTLAILGMAANLLIMVFILTNKALRRWSQGLIFHQSLVDCARAAILVPLGVSVLNCSSLHKCSILEMTFVLLVTVSTINMLTTVLNDAPLIPDEEENPLPLLMDSPKCMLFGMGMIWFAGLTINLGPTFLSGALSSNQEAVDMCPLVYGPMRHHIINILWIIINLLCILLTCFHLRKLYKDLSRAPLDAIRAASLVTAMVSMQCDGGDAMLDAHTPHIVRSYVHRFEREGIERVKMFVITTVAYVLFWSPLFLVTIIDPGAKRYTLSYEITLHVAFVHAFVNPTLLLVFHKGLRRALTDIICCYCECAGGDNNDNDHDHDHDLDTPIPPPPPPRFPTSSSESDGDVSPCAPYPCTINRSYMETTL